MIGVSDVYEEKRKGKHDGGNLENIYRPPSQTVRQRLDSVEGTHFDALLMLQTLRKKPSWLVP